MDLGIKSRGRTNLEGVVQADSETTRLTRSRSLKAFGGTDALPDLQTESTSYRAQTTIPDIKPDSSATVTESLPSELASPFAETVFSEKYFQYRTKELVDQLIPNFRKWAEVGTEDGLSYISAIGILIERYAKFLDHRSENRILLGTLQLALNHENLDEYTPSQISTIALELRRFSEGRVERNDVATFTKQLNRAGIGLLS